MYIVVGVKAVGRWGGGLATISSICYSFDLGRSIAGPFQNFCLKIPLKFETFIIFWKMSEYKLIKDKHDIFKNLCFNLMGL